jgi:hypothetical protein
MLPPYEDRTRGADALARGIGRIAPRFIPKKQREQRLANFCVLKEVPEKAKFLIRGKKEGSAVHYADATGKVRFFSAVSDIKNLKPIEDTSLSNAALPLKIKPVRTWQWEAAALDRIEAGRVEDALKLLLAGVQLTLATRDRPNLRLLDLLAGISVRYEKKGSHYFEELKSTVSAEISRPHDPISIERLKTRLKKWSNSNPQSK